MIGIVKKWTPFYSNDDAHMYLLQIWYAHWVYIMGENMSWLSVCCLPISKLCSGKIRSLSMHRFTTQKTPQTSIFIFCVFFLAHRKPVVYYVKLIPSYNTVILFLSSMLIVNKISYMQYISSNWCKYHFQSISSDEYIDLGEQYRSFEPLVFKCMQLCKSIPL